MNLAYLIPCALLFATAIIFGIRSNVIFYRILDEVNASRATKQQISFLFVSVQMWQVMAEHAKLHPADIKREQMKWSLSIGFACLFLVAACLILHSASR